MTRSKFSPLDSPTEKKGQSAQSIILGLRKEMMAHETIGVNLPAGLHASFAERAHERAPIVVVAKDRLTMIAATHQVVDSSRIFDAQWTWRDGSFGLGSWPDLVSGAAIVNCEDPFPFPFRWIIGRGADFSGRTIL